MNTYITVSHQSPDQK